MKYDTSFIMERVEIQLKALQRECKPDSREYHFHFAVAMACSLHDIPDLATLDDFIASYVMHTPYPKQDK